MPRTVKKAPEKHKYARQARIGRRASLRPDLTAPLAIMLALSLLGLFAAALPTALGHGYVQQVKFDSPAAAYPGYNYNTVRSTCYRGNCTC
jgi:hypothetical protein